MIITCYVYSKNKLQMTNLYVENIEKYTFSRLEDEKKNI